MMTTFSPTADLLERAIAASPLRQKEIAKRAGFPKPNVLSMLKSGETKVPIDRIPALAEALGIDPAEFIRVAMQEYQPEVWDVLTDTMMLNLSPDEFGVLMIFRMACQEGPVEVTHKGGELILTLFKLLGEQQRGK